MEETSTVMKPNQHGTVEQVQTHTKDQLQSTIADRMSNYGQIFPVVLVGVKSVRSLSHITPQVLRGAANVLGPLCGSPFVHDAFEVLLCRTRTPVCQRCRLWIAVPTHSQSPISSAALYEDLLARAIFPAESPV